MPTRIASCMALSLVALAAPGLLAGEVRLPASARNLLVEAKVTSNLESYRKGRRGRPEDMVFDPANGRFLRDSQ